MCIDTVEICFGIATGLNSSIFSSPGLCPWRAYDVTQALGSVSVRVRVGVSIRVSTMSKFSNVCIVF